MASTGTLLMRTGRLVTLLQRAEQSCRPTDPKLKGCQTAALTLQTRLSSQDATASHTFDEKTLEHLVCPLSKKDLRYDKENKELVCDEVGVAYPIINGIPNLVPQDARMLKNTHTQTTES